MSERSTVPIESKAELIAWLEAGACPKKDWRIGTEHEKFLFDRRSLARPPYEGEGGIGALLKGLADEHGWTAIMEGEYIIGLKDNNGGAITLEPGGQFELSGAPLENLHQTCGEANRHLEYLREATGRLGLGMLGVGFDPLWSRNDIPWMPKGRYRIMREHMPKVGSLGLDMMLRTSTIQVNLDYAGEKDMARKFRTSLALQPVATAIFANSPFRDGKASGLLSSRAEVWTDTDPARCGVPACVFDPGFGYEQWVDYILDVPMYFLYFDGVYVDVAGLSFRDFMAGRLPGHEGKLPTINDWTDHLTTAFPEVRLKSYLEMRGADGGPWNMICALPALWTGLLYDDDALTAAEELAARLTAEDAAAARMEAARYGLKGEIGGQSILEIARGMVRIAGEGLHRRGYLDTSGNDETGFLSPIRRIVDSGITSAETLIGHYEGKWQGKVDPLYEEFQF